jgi:hypothetical protein
MDVLIGVRTLISMEFVGIVIGMLIGLMDSVVGVVTGLTPVAVDGGPPTV